MTSIFRIIVVVFCCSVVSCQKEVTNKSEEIKDYVNTIDSSEFSGTILVAHKDAILVEKAYGLSNIEYGIKNTVATKFNIASITKLMTAVATLQLYEQGKLKLHNPIGDYLPNYPNALVRDSVTVHQLLTHTSGLNNFYVTHLNHLKPLDYKTTEDFLPLFVSDSLLSKPGTTYNYSASGYVLLGLIIEKIAGKSFYQYLEEHICKVVNMPNTMAIEVDVIVKNTASGYTSMFGENKTLKKNDYYLTKASPGGFYYSTTRDLFSFFKALKNYELLNKETTELMLSEKVKGYNTHLGYGIDIDKNNNEKIIGQSGGWYGIHCELMHFTKSNYTVIILSNIDDDGTLGASEVTKIFKDIIL